MKSSVPIVDDLPRSMFTKTEEAKGFLEHLTDLRSCIIKVLIAVLICFMASIFASRGLLELIIAHAGKLVVLQPVEGFMAQLKIAFIAGLVLSFPVILWQVGSFIWPALYSQERRALLLYLPFAVILFFAGVTFGFLIIVRLGYQFLMAQVPNGVEPHISLDNYLSFVLSSALTCGIVFLMPVLILLLARLGILKAKFLWRQQKVVIVGLMILVAFITPTVDAFSMFLVFVPLLLLFEFSILLAWLSGRRHEKRLAEREKI